MTGEEQSRQLVTVRVIDRLEPIDGADRIEVATVGGWKIVVKKGEFEAGDSCVYFELDSFLPTDDPRFSFLADRGVRTADDGRVGHVLTTARLRGVFSQGLVMPVGLFPELHEAHAGERRDLARLISVTKWEPPLPAGLAGEVIGSFPRALARKTDSERVQNLAAVYPSLRRVASWVATEKVDGSSATYIKAGGGLRVCGRNWEYAESSDNTLWALAHENDLAQRLHDGWVVQAEVFGEGVQSNPLRITGQRLAVFSMFIDGRAVPRSEWPTWLGDLAVPELAIELPATIDEALLQADGLDSSISPGRRAEGIVWHTADGSTLDALDGRGTFKVISNRYLMKHDR